MSKIEIHVKKYTTGIVKRDQFSWSWGYQLRPVVLIVGDAPAVNRTGEFDNPHNFIRSTLTAPWQWFWADLCAMRVFGTTMDGLNKEDANSIKELVTNIGQQDKFLTNRKGLDNCTNYLYGIDRGEDPQVDPLICAGSRVRILDVKYSSIVGQDMAKLWTFKEWETPPPVTQELLDKDPRILRAVNIYANGEILNFDQIYNRWPNLPDTSVPYPYISRQSVWFPKIDLE